MLLPDPTESAWAIRRAIACNQPEDLRRALASAPPNWSELVCGGFTCWSRVLTDSKRARKMWSVLAETGLNVAPFVTFRGKRQPPVYVALKHGSYALIGPLLDAGASATFSVRRRSVLSYLIDRLTHPLASPAAGAIRRRRDWEASAWQKDHLVWALPLTERLWDAGARPCAKTMSQWMVLAATQSTDGPWREWVRRGWAEGARPGFGDDSTSELSTLTPVLRLAMVQPGAESNAWLEHQLQAHPATPWWGVALLGRRGDVPELVESELDALLSTVRRAQSPLEASAWDEPVRNAWESGWAKRSWLTNNELRIRVRLLEWALDNGLPIDRTTVSPRPLLLPLLQVGPWELRKRALAACFAAGVTLDAPCQRSDANDALEPAVLRERLMDDRNFPGLWRDHGVEIEAMNAAAHLSRHLKPQATSARKRL